MGINTTLIKSGVNLISSMKQARLVLTSALYIAGGVIAPMGTANAASTEPMKWHPGHYYMLVGDGKSSSNYLNEVYTEMKNTPALRGAVIRYKWAELEPTFGAYDFSAIDLRLAELKSRNKRLIILLETKSAGDNPEDIVPMYVRTPAYENGTFHISAQTGRQGRNMKLWNPAIQTRLSALIHELGKRYNAHPNFEGFGFTETAMGNPDSPLSAAQIDHYYDNLLELNQAARTSFPATMTFQYMNHPRKVLPTFINTMKNTGWAIGCPDVFIEDEGLLAKATKYTSQGLYNYYPDLAGSMPLTVQIEDSNYRNTKYDNTGYKPSVTNLLNFAKDTLDVNYIFWTRTPEYAPAVLKLLNSTTQKSTISGGLKSACPGSYKSCVTN